VISNLLVFIYAQLPDSTEEFLSDSGASVSTLELLLPAYQTQKKDCPYHPKRGLVIGTNWQLVMLRTPFVQRYSGFRRRV
jgi:hypothetical protein